MKRTWLVFAVAFCAASLLSTAAVNAQNSDSTTMVTKTTSDDWDIGAPIFLRAATPEEEGELVVKNIFGWAKQRDNEEEWEYELEFEYGFAHNHELIVAFPWEIGEGRVEGNGNLELGWQWRLREEGDCQTCGRCVPAFAMRNIVHLPTGVDASGFDYTWKGLFTHSITPGKSRLHFNPYVSWMGNNNDEKDEDFDSDDWRYGSYFRNDNHIERLQYGAAVGMDYKLNDDMLLVWDYLWKSPEWKDGGDNQFLEIALEWEFADDQMLSFATEFGINNEDGSEYGAKLMYQFELQ